MLIDYKDVSFSFKRKKKENILKKIKLALLIITILAGFIVTSSFFALQKLKKVQSLFLQNQINKAGEKLADFNPLFFFSGPKLQLTGLDKLFNNDLVAARYIFKSIKSGSSLVRDEDFLNYFSDNGQYEKLKIYTDFVVHYDPGKTMFKALYKTAFFDHDGSEKIINSLTKEDKEYNKEKLAILSVLNQKLKQGKLEYIFGLNGEPLAYYDFSKRRTVSLCHGISFNDFTPDFQKGIKFFKLTIDLKIQQKVNKLFTRFSGTFILFNLRDNSIAAAYSAPLSKGDNLVFTQNYEPGSIIKLITAFSYLKNKSQKAFPLKCRSFNLDGEDFYGWTDHGQVNSIEEALVISCNIGLARCGLSIGFKNLKKYLEIFAFNSEGFRDQFIIFKTGNFQKPINDFELANLSVGLSNFSQKRTQKKMENLINLTTFHSGLLSGILAQNGKIYIPYLIKNIKNIFRLGYYNHKPELREFIKDGMLLTKIKRAMAETVTDKKGTGRHARVSFIQTAVKTGTTGRRRKFNAIMTGFFPTGEPEYAFAFRLAGGGKAELTGATFFKEFLISFYQK